MSFCASKKSIDGPFLIILGTLLLFIAIHSNQTRSKCLFSGCLRLTQGLTLSVSTLSLVGCGKLMSSPNYLTHDCSGSYHGHVFQPKTVCQIWKPGRENNFRDNVPKCRDFWIQCRLGRYAKICLLLCNTLSLVDNMFDK